MKPSRPSALTLAACWAGVNPMSVTQVTGSWALCGTPVRAYPGRTTEPQVRCDRTETPPCAAVELAPHELAHTGRTDRPATNMIGTSATARRPLCLALGMATLPLRPREAER